MNDTAVPPIPPPAPVGPIHEITINGAVVPYLDGSPYLVNMIGAPGQPFILLFSTPDKWKKFAASYRLEAGFTFKTIVDAPAFIASIRESGVRIALDSWETGDGKTRYREVRMADEDMSDLFSTGAHNV